MDNEEAFNEKNRLSADLLGKGGFSEIFKGIRLSDGHSVAIKKVKRTLVHSHCELLASIKGQLVPMEYCIWKLVSNCSGVIELFDAYEISDEYYFVMELLPTCCTLNAYNELWDFRLKESQVKLYFESLVESLDEFHQKNVFHRDIKGDNILYDFDTGKFKFIDFGISALATNSPYRDTFGTPDYMAPEIMYAGDSNYDGMAATVYSLGVVFYDLLFGTIGWEPINEEQKISTIPSVLCLRLLNKMLAKNPEDRPSLQQILQDPWIKAINWY